MEQRARRTLVAALVIVSLSCGSGTGPLEAAIEVAADDDQFGSGQEAGESLARIAQHLQVAGRECDTAESGARCSAINAANGYAQVLALRVLQCTAPGRFQARTAMLALLREIEALEPTGDIPAPSALPDCT